MVVWLALIAVFALAGLAALLRRPRPICKLTLREEEGLGLEFPIASREATIGSEEGQTVVVSDPRVARQHAVLTFEDGRFVLRNRSRQGTCVNGRSISEAVLRGGDLISLAESVDLIFTPLKITPLRRFIGRRM